MHEASGSTQLNRTQTTGNTTVGRRSGVWRYENWVTRVRLSDRYGERRRAPERLATTGDSSDGNQSATG